MHYRLEGEPRRVDKNVQNSSMGDWVIEKNDPVTKVKSTWVVRTDQSYAERTDVLPNGLKRIISDFTQGTPRHTLSINAPHVGLTLTQLEDRREFHVTGISKEEGVEQTWIYTTYRETGWLGTIDLHTFPLPRKGGGIEVASQGDQRVYYGKRPFGDNLRQLAQIMRLREATPADDVDVLSMKGISEFNLGLMRVTTGFLSRYQSAEDRAKSKAVEEQAKQFVEARTLPLLSAEFGQAEIKTVLSWLNEFMSGNLRGVTDPVNEKTLEQLLKSAVVSFIIDHHSETLSASALHLVTGFYPDANPENFTYKVLGEGAKIVTNGARKLGEPFTYGGNRFCVDGDNQLRYSIQSLRRTGHRRVLELPRFIAPETMDRFEQVVGIKSNTGWEQGIFLVGAKYSAPI